MSKFLTEFSSKFMEFIPKSMGANGRFRIPKSQLTEMAKQDESGAVQRVLEGLQNPSLDVAYKAQSNYSIAAINLRDGSKSVAKGAVSVVNPGEEALVKARISVGENGEILRADGFVDASKYPDINNSAAGIVRKNGTMTVNARVGDAYGGHISVNTEKAEQLAERFPHGAELVEKYRGGVTDVATSANKAMQRVKDTFARRETEFRCEQPIIKTSPKGMAQAMEPVKSYVPKAFADKYINEIMANGNISKAEILEKVKSGYLGKLSEKDLNELAQKYNLG